MFTYYDFSREIRASEVIPLLFVSLWEGSWVKHFLHVTLPPVTPSLASVGVSTLAQPPGQVLCLPFSVVSLSAHSRLC